MYLADDYFRKSNVRHQSEIIFASAKSIIFDVTKYANALEKVVLRKDIQTMYKRNLIEIRPDSKEALFEHLETGEQEVFTYDLLHVTPPMKAPSCIKESALADAGGWVDVDPYTLAKTKSLPMFSELRLCQPADVQNRGGDSQTGSGCRAKSDVLDKRLFIRCKVRWIYLVPLGYRVQQTRAGRV